MKLSTQEEYGLRCLLHMARQGAGASLSIPEISRAEGLSVPNVAKLMRLLRMGGLVASVRGQSGGYTLSRTSEQITLGSVLELLGGRLYGPSFCDRHSGLLEACAHNSDCSLRPVWETLQAMIENVLNRMTLSDLQRNEKEMMKMLNERTNQLLPVSQIRRSA